MSSINKIDLVYVGELAQGPLAISYVANWRKYTTVAVREIMAGPDEKSLARRLCSISHPCLLSCHGLYEGSSSVLIVTKLMPSSLETMLAGNPGKVLSEWMSAAFKIAKGLDYLHSIKILHRGLTHKNVLMDGDEVVIADFGLKPFRDYRAKKSMAGSGLQIMNFMPIEELDKKMVPTSKSDIYSFGQIARTMITGKIPFSDCEDTIMYRKILAGEQDPLPQNCMQTVADLITKCTLLDPKERPSLDYVLEYFADQNHKESLWQPFRLKVLTLMCMGLPKELVKSITHLMCSKT